MPTRAEKIDALVAYGLAEVGAGRFNNLPRSGLERGAESDVDEFYERFILKTHGQRVADVLDRHGISRVTLRGGEPRSVAHLDDGHLDAATATAALSELQKKYDHVQRQIDEYKFDRVAAIRELITEHHVFDMALGEQSNDYLAERLRLARMTDAERAEYFATIVNDTTLD